MNMKMMQDMKMKKDAMHEQMPSGLLSASAKKHGKLGRRARLAKTLKKMK